MIRIDKITTKSGDKGETSLGDGSRVSKGDYRIKLLGSLDKSSSLLGLAYLSLEEGEVKKEVLKLINNFFDIGAYIASNGSSDLELRPLIDNITDFGNKLNMNLKPLNSFILPTNGEASVRLSIARTSVRETESLFWESQSKLGNIYSSDFGILLNRISDLLFILSRLTSVNEELWVPINTK